MSFEFGIEGAKNDDGTVELRIEKLRNGNLQLGIPYNMPGIKTFGEFMDQAAKAGVRKFTDI